MKTYNKNSTKTTNIIKDFLEEKEIQVGFCKYSNSFYNKIPGDLWEKGDEKVSDEYVNYSDWEINFEYNKEDKHSSSGMVTIVKANVPTKHCAGFGINKTSWKSALNLIGRPNEIDTSKDFFNSLYFNYDKKDLEAMSETDKFVKQFVKYCKGDTNMNEKKMKTLLFSVVKKGLGGKAENVAVFKSLEGTGKTEFITKELFGSFKKANLMNENAKLDEDEWKFKDKLADYCVTFIEESGIGEKAHNQFKNMTSLEDFKIKPKGGNNDIKKLSRSIMIFSTNDNQFIYGNDVKNRRFLVFDLQDKKLRNYNEEKNNFDSVFAGIDYDKIWSEQYHLLITGGNVLFLELWDHLEMENREYVVKTNFKTKDVLAINLLETEILDYNGVECWLSSADVLTMLKDSVDVDMEFNKNDQDGVTKALIKSSTQSKRKKCKTVLNIPTIEYKRDVYYTNAHSNRSLVKIKQEVYDNYATSNISNGGVSILEILESKKIKHP